MKHAPNLRAILGGTALLLTAGVGIFFLQRNYLQTVVAPATLQATQAEQAMRREAQQLTLLKTLPDFGFRNLIANWLFFNYLQYFGNGEARQFTGYGLSGDYLEVILQHDPYYYLFHYFPATGASLFAGQAERVVALQDQYLRTVLSPSLPPEAYYLWRNKGIDELLFLGDVTAARESYSIAADWAELSPLPDSERSAPGFRNTAAFLATYPDATQPRINAWAQILSSAPDQKTRLLAVENIRSLGGDVVQRPDGRYSIVFDRTAPETEP